MHYIFQHTQIWFESIVALQHKGLASI